MRRENPYEYIELKTKRQNFVYWIFEDRDFQNDISKLDKWMKEVTKRSKPNELKWRKLVVDGLIKRKKHITSEYGLNDYEFSAYYYSLHKWHGFNASILDIRISEIDESSLSVRMRPDITRSEYVEAWKEIQYFIKEEYPKRAIPMPKTKRKQEIDYQLIYAVSKAVRSNESFSEIFNQYQDGTLKRYNRAKRNRFKTIKELRDYYYLHRIKDFD